jgi:DNA-binding response OmpR family regulator
MEFRPEPVELKKLAGEVCDVLRQLAANKRIRIQSDVDASLSDVVADPARLKQVLYNYLSNSLKFTPDEGRVMLRFLPEGDMHFRLEVEDTGIGIKPEDISRLFVEFQQLDASTAKKYQGTGLGLALTRRIVESQGGQVGLKSELGKGSIFFAVLPRVMKSSDQVMEESVVLLPIQPAAVDAPRVLVIEDQPKDLEWLERTIRQAGYQVQSAQTGTEAVELAMRHQFDVITLDLLLPDMPGQDVLNLIREKGPNQETPVIIVTVVADRSLVTAYRISDMLTKPVEPHSLLTSLRRARVPVSEERPILIIDDDPAVLKQIMTPLTERGFRPILETDADQALKTVEREIPAAVILDLRMPGLNGFEFLRRFRRQERFCDVPVIVWTALSLTKEQHTMLRVMTEHVVEKESGTVALLNELDACIKTLAKKKVA